MTYILQLGTVIKVSIRVLLLCAAFSESAHAYIDAGSGLLLLQGLFAAIGAALTFVKKPWQKIANLFRKSKKDDA